MLWSLKLPSILVVGLVAVWQESASSSKASKSGILLLLLGSAQDGGTLFECRRVELLGDLLLLPNNTVSLLLFPAGIIFCDLLVK